MSKQQRDAIDAALRAEPFGLSQSTEEHRKSFEAFALRPYPADVAAVFSPWADISRSGASMRTKDGTDPLFSYDAMGWYADRYMPVGDRSAPQASPVFATLADLPPLLIQAGTHEVLLDDAIRLAANTGRDDVDVTLQVATEGTHVFQLHFGALDEADEAINEVARFFKRHLG